MSNRRRFLGSLVGAVVGASVSPAIKLSAAQCKSVASFPTVELTVRKFTAAIFVTDEILADSAFTEKWIMEAFAAEVSSVGATQITPTIYAVDKEMRIARATARCIPRRDDPINHKRPEYLDDDEDFDD